MDSVQILRLLVRVDKLDVWILHHLQLLPHVPLLRAHTRQLIDDFKNVLVAADLQVVRHRIHRLDLELLPGDAAAFFAGLVVRVIAAIAFNAAALHIVG